MNLADITVYRTDPFTQFVQWRTRSLCWIGFRGNEQRNGILDNKFCPVYTPFMQKDGLQEPPSINC
jgi:hypothetical protein